MKGVPSVFVEVALFFVFVVVAGRRLDLAVVHLEGREVFPGLGELSCRRGGPGSIATPTPSGGGREEGRGGRGGGGEGAEGEGREGERLRPSEEGVQGDTKKVQRMEITK